MSDIVQRFARIAADRPDRRLIYAPATNDVLTASHVWQSHLELRQQLSALGIQPGQLIVSAAGNRPAAISLVAGVPVAARAADAHRRECDCDGSRAVRRAVWRVRRRHAGRINLRLVRQKTASVAYSDAALLKLTSGSTGFPKAILTAESHLIADAERIVRTMDIAGRTRNSR